MKKQLTLSVITNDNKILLGMKKRGFGVGKWNGFGGKVETGETIEAAMARELSEETGLAAQEMHLVAKFDFYFPADPVIMEVHVFKIDKFSGEAIESEEMQPGWFAFSDIPYAEMWPDDEFWLPRVLAGEKLHGYFKFDEKGVIYEQQLDIISDFD
jgi:8-oxo-dGTP diphosphatase/2-hydroxy-dATP diphosphatase